MKWFKFIQKVNTYVLVLLSNLVFSQAPDTTWTSNYHRGSYDMAYSIQQTSDNGFILAGESHLINTNYTDIMLVKTNAMGDSQWAKVYTDSLGLYAYSIQEDPTRNFVIAGKRYTSWGVENAYFLKTDENGDSLWSFTFGGDRNTYAVQVVCTPDSSYMFTGWQNRPSTYNDIFVYKMNANGGSGWYKYYNRGSDERANCIAATSDKGYIIGGFTDFHTAGMRDYYIIKIDSVGDTLWTKTYGSGWHDQCYAVQQTTDGGYILYGDSDSSSTTRALAIKTDPLGNVEWQKAYYRGTWYDKGRSVQQTSDGGFIFGGDSHNFGQGNDFGFFRTDLNGDTLWTKMVDNGGTEFAHSVLQSHDGGYILAGGTSYIGPHGGDFWVVKLNAFPTTIEEKKNISSTIQLMQNYPNPFNPTTTIEFNLPKSTKVTLKIFNILGEEVETLLSAFLHSGLHSYTWDARNYASSIYYYKIQAGDFCEVKKMILMK